MYRSYNFQESSAWPRRRRRRNVPRVAHLAVIGAVFTGSLTGLAGALGLPALAGARTSTPPAAMTGSATSALRPAPMPTTHPATASPNHPQKHSPNQQLVNAYTNHP